MGFIQVDQGVVTHRKTLRLARLLGEDRYTITGRLVALWTWCLDSAISGSLAHIEPDILADVMGYPGKPAELIEGLITVGFLDLGDDGHLSIHNWMAYRRRNSDGRDDWNRLRATLTPVVYDRDGHACVYCGATDELTIDHVIPLSRGGNNHLNNLTTACRRCNQSKYNRTPEEWQV